MEQLAQAVNPLRGSRGDPQLEAPTGDGRLPCRRWVRSRRVRLWACPRVDLEKEGPPRWEAVVPATWSVKVRLGAHCSLPACLSADHLLRHPPHVRMNNRLRVTGAMNLVKGTSATFSFTGGPSAGFSLSLPAVQNVPALLCLALPQVILLASKQPSWEPMRRAQKKNKSNILQYDDQAPSSS